MKNPLDIVRTIAAIMLLIAFAELPYGYYQVLRWVVCATTAYGALVSYENKNIFWVWAFGITAVIFNPIVPFYLDRGTWQLLDIAAALLLFISLKKFRPVSHN